MTLHEANDPLRHMLAYAKEATALASGKERHDLDTDRLLNLALVRLLEVIGEAATRVPAETRMLLPAVPWRPIVGLRNRLIHGYDAVDFDILWQIITQDLPVLIQALEDTLPNQA